MAETTLTIGSRVLAPGNVILGPFNVPRNLTSFRVELDATQHLNPGVMLTIAVELSFDNGSTWAFVASGSRSGGVVFEDGGAVSTTMVIETDLPDPTNNQRRIRFPVTLNGGSFTTAGGTVVVR